MKNSANARAPVALCCVAATGMTGGRSPGLVFGPLVGTSAGTAGVAGTIAVGELDNGAEDDGALAGGVDDGTVDDE